MTQLVAPVVPEAVGHTLGLLRQYSAAAVAFAFAASAVQNRLAQTAIMHLVTRLRGPVTIDEVRDALRTALADDDLQVLYWVPELAAYVDSTGDPVEVDVTDDRLVFDTPTADGLLLARIVADPSLRRHEGLVAAAVQVQHPGAGERPSGGGPAFPAARHPGGASPPVAAPVSSSAASWSGTCTTAPSNVSSHSACAWARSRRPRATRRPRRPSRRPGRSCTWPSASCATWRTASTPPS